MYPTKDGRERLATEIRRRLADLESNYNKAVRSGRTGISAGQLSRYARGLFREISGERCFSIDRALEWDLGTAATYLDDDAWTEKPRVMTGNADLDAELNAMITIVEELESFPPATIERVLRYMARRFNITVPSL